MNPKTPVISFEASVPEAIDYLKNHAEGFAIVQASAERFHGVVTEASMMRMFLRFQSQPDKDAVILYRDLFEPAQLIQEDEFFPELVKKIVTAVGSRVFVINRAGALAGYITAKDILPYFSQTPPSAAAEAKPMEHLRSDLYLFETFFAKSPFMMHSVNKEGHIRMANEMLHSVLGYEYGELIGKTIFDLYPKEAHAQAAAGIKTIFSKGFHQVVRGKMVNKAGEAIEVELVSRALTNQLNEIVGTMTVSRPFDMNYLLTKMSHL